MSKLILVVEDNPDLSRVLRDLLVEEGFAVDLSTDGEDGWDLVGGRRFEGRPQTAGGGVHPCGCFRVGHGAYAGFVFLDLIGRRRDRAASAAVALLVSPQPREAQDGDTGDDGGDDGRWNGPRRRWSAIA